jgi:hypothetical protein
MKRKFIWCKILLLQYSKESLQHLCISNQVLEVQPQVMKLQLKEVHIIHGYRDQDQHYLI